MGTRYTAKCNNCGNTFHASEGGGFHFHLLHCDKCGVEKSINFEALGEARLKYIKGLYTESSSFSKCEDNHIQDNKPGKSISEAEYYSEIENFAGKCYCGGKYKNYARARCPKCLSQDYVQNSIDLYYD